MSLDPDTLGRLIEQCDPQLPLAADDPMYVDFDADPPTRGERSAVETLRKTIALARRQPSCQLFTGFPGAGKSTELRRLAGRLREAPGDPSHVVYIDFNEYVDLYAPISVVDVIRVIAYCLDRSATLAEGEDPAARPGYLKRLFDFMATRDLQLKEFGFEAYGASLMLELKVNPSFRQRLERVVQGRFQAFVAEARGAIRDAIARILNAPAAKAERVVVIADGLEKLTPLREEERGLMEASVETLFVAHRDLLQLPCHVIYTFPLWLRFRAPNLGTEYRREPLILPMIKLAERDGSPFTPGLEKLVELVRLRVEDLSGVFGPTLEATLIPLIQASGGYPRDLLRMIRSLLFDARSFPVSAAETQRVIEELGRTYDDTLLGTYLDVLARVHRTKTLPRDDLAERTLAGYLFERWMILAYRNGVEWYDLHPLVRASPRLQERLQDMSRETASG